eukprot:m.102946 g.102946  ORF g.102946 m.102946 type:complete len:126 (+) comp20844_c0_seq1:279-656(+)
MGDLQPWEWILVLGLLSLGLKLWAMRRFSRRADTDPALVIPIGLRPRVVMLDEYTLRSNGDEAEDAPFLSEETASGHQPSTAVIVADVPPRYIDSNAILSSEANPPEYPVVPGETSDPPPEYSMA